MLVVVHFVVAVFVFEKTKKQKNERKVARLRKLLKSKSRRHQQELRDRKGNH